MTIGSTLQGLIREGVVILYQDFRSGDCLDRGSLKINHGTPSAGCRWSGRALTFPATTDNVSVVHHASQQFLTGSVIILGRWEKQPAAQVLLRKLTGAADCNHYWLANATQLYVYDGVSSRTLTIDIKGARSLGITYTAGATPVGYKDGISSGNYSGTINFVASTQPLYIGGVTDSNRNAVEAVVMCNRVLTATEMAAVHSDLVNMKWPSRCTSIAKRVQGSVIGEPTLKAGYTLKPVGASVPSHNGAFVGTVSGNALYRDSILGPALELGRVTGAVDLGIGNATINPTTDSHWVEVWARPVDVPMVDVKAPIIGKNFAGGYDQYPNGGIVHHTTYAALYWYETAPVAMYKAVIGVPEVPRNRLTHYLYQFDHTAHNAYLYIDGVQYGPTAIGTMNAVAATNWIVGKTGGTSAAFDEGFGGLVCNPRIGLGVLTAAQVQARYLEGAKAIQFKTGYGFQISPAAEGGVLDQQIGGKGSPFRAADTTGRWTIETSTIEGKSCKVLTCMTSGSLYIPASCFGDSTPTENAFGTWELWVKRTAGMITRGSFICPSTGVGAAPLNGYRWQIEDANTYLIENAVGIMLTAAAVTAGVWHRLRVTRSITGLFTLYIDGVAVGTATDVTTLTSLFFNLDIDAGDKIALGDSLGGHGICKMLGVVSPS